jgi:hypothetical protein
LKAHPIFSFFSFNGYTAVNSFFNHQSGEFLETPMSEVLIEYAFDPTGQNPANAITNEQHAVAPPPWKDYHFLLPRLAPFFLDSMVVEDRAQGRTLTEGIDWIATHRFVQASRYVAKPIYGSVSILDKTFVGVLTLRYQTLGGDWTLDEHKTYEILLNKAINPRLTTWEEVANPPCQFPVIDHQWHVDDMVGMSAVRDAIDRLHATIVARNEADTLPEEHLTDTTNPHQVTKTQIGLSEVENYPPATLDLATTGIDHASYMTPRRTRQAIEQFAYLYTDAAITALKEWVKGYAVTPEQLQAAISDLHSISVGHVNQTNPHTVTPEQVGLNQLVLDDSLMTLDSAITPLNDALAPLLLNAGLPS